MRCDTCRNPNEDQNLTTTDGPSASSFSGPLREKEGSKLIPCSIMSLLRLAGASLGVVVVSFETLSFFGS